MHNFFPNGDMDAATKKRDIRRHDGAFGIRVGALRDILAQRKFPWGIKSIMTSHGLDWIKAEF